MYDPVHGKKENEKKKTKQANTLGWDGEEVDEEAHRSFGDLLMMLLYTCTFWGPGKKPI